ncbi:MAG: trypsin-like peptidase domain-containing protein [Lachnospiraceae bacterium]|nr:trypsin-like peptidase domain-containing protein [Lachnospiraceae bacterium]
MDDQNLSPKQTEDDEGEYHFLKETVKEKPISGRRVLSKALFAIVCGALFGVTAAGVFYGVTTSAKSRAASRVTFSEDEGGEAMSSSAPAVETPTETSTPTPTPTETQPTEQDENALALADYETLNAAMKEIADKANVSVVEVTGIKSQEDWFQRTDTSTVTQSGLIVANNGTSLLILTSSDSVAGANEIAVTMPDETIARASLVKRDSNTGLCVVSIPLNTLGESTLASCAVADLGNSYTVSTGDSVIAIGSPLGYSDSVAYGEITSTKNTVSVVDGEYNLLTTDIQGSPDGNGFLINLKGQVVGCIFQKYATQNTAVVTGVPISLLKYLIEELSNNSSLSYAGIHGQSVTREISKSSGIPVGVYISAVEADSPALAAGLQAGDILVKMDGLDVSSMQLVHNKLTSMKPGDTVPIKVERTGPDGYVEFDFQLTIGEAK